MNNMQIDVNIDNTNFNVDIISLVLLLYNGEL